MTGLTQAHVRLLKLLARQAVTESKRNGRPQLVRRMEPHRLVLPQPIIVDQDATSFVYAVQQASGGPLKIGFAARDVAARLRTLQTGSATELVVRYVFRAHRHREIELHDALDAYRLKGEWFEYCNPVVAFLHSYAMAAENQSALPRMLALG